ncbi:MAG: hypothetical protein KF773_00715 [Deltaproteobacteria bacterium]|nr:hypothetical protein [Deltaproteobacteria bacterium]
MRRASAPAIEPSAYQPPPKLLAIDWDAVALHSDADANALWAQIAPRPDDWDAKLEEVPARFHRPLGVALLRGGNFTCAPAPRPADCALRVFDVPAPGPDAGVSDPCLRRLLALWSLEQLEPGDLPQVTDSLKAIVAIPAPESQLVVAALRVVPENDHPLRLALLGIAQAAGQREIASSHVGPLDESHMIEAALKHRIDGALDVLSAKGHRAVYLAALRDEGFSTKARISAIAELMELDDKIPQDLRSALAIAAGGKDCGVAAAAARALDKQGDKRFVPSAANTRPTTPDKLVRALCVLASYEAQGHDEASLLGTYVPAKGLERVTVAYDALSEVDRDGDGDPHTQRTVELVPRDASLVLPEVEDMVRAFASCKGTTCTSEDREYTFVTRPGGSGVQLGRLEIVERPPCSNR